jgi:murein DD-endopeptidase MepM/ murein hydrolase activator NlpD
VNLKSGARVGLAIVIAVTVGIVFAIQRLEGTPPTLHAPDEIILGKAGKEVSIVLEDLESGLRNLSVRLLHRAGSHALLNEEYPGNPFLGTDSPARTRSVELSLHPESLQAPDGTATLIISTRDWSWRDGFAGNRSERSIPVQIDTRAPEIDLMSGLTYVYRGGSAAGVYRLNEEASFDGVQVGNTFSRGYPHPSGEDDLRFVLFAVPVEAEKDTPIRVVAIDRAGNRGEVRFPARILEKVFAESELEISQTFIERVADPLARQANLPTDSPEVTFRGVNEELRRRNEETIRERLAASSEATQHWQGAFRQLANSAVTSRFAEHRTYRLEEKDISESRHYGFDLASTAQAPITASAGGVVVLAENLGIYGRCVVIDHGLGIASLYGHLSSLKVEAGEKVESGQVLGRSGASGLAGGDHLHFAILVGDSYVDPLEWWDPKWVRSHVEVRLERSSP